MKRRLKQWAAKFLETQRKRKAWRDHLRARGNPSFVPVQLELHLRTPVDVALDWFMHKERWARLRARGGPERWAGLRVRGGSSLVIYAKELQLRSPIDVALFCRIHKERWVLLRARLKWWAFVFWRYTYHRRMRDLKKITTASALIQIMKHRGLW